MVTADRRFSKLCGVIHTLAQKVDPIVGPERGWRWEQQIDLALLRCGYDVKALAAGASFLGAYAASGLRHQVDAQIRCERAFVIGEWKAFSNPIPKNELLRFKAVSDDIYEELSQTPQRVPIFRLFGASGDGSPELRSYAARHGIALVERNRWPAPVLADPDLLWPLGQAPAEADRRRLEWLYRPMQLVMQQGPAGSLVIPRPPSVAAVEALLRLQDRWSEKLDVLLKGGPLPSAAWSMGS